LTLAFTKSGEAAINFEHSWGDGVAVLRFFNEIFADTTNRPYITPKTEASFEGKGDLNKWITKLEFKLDDSVREAIGKAEANYRRAQASIHLRCFENLKYGKEFVKTKGLSPDSLMQSAIQIAFHKTFGRFVATYESASTCAFKHGRTETVRPLTEPVKAMAEFATKNGTSNPEEIVKMMRDCTKVHNQLVKEGKLLFFSFNILSFTSAYS
jgi:carnitine O-palmitoyltransferase 2